MDISKLDAAKRQLDTAINLFFKNADVVSIHTLTAAAHQLLMDIANLEGIKSFMKDTELIRKGKEKEYLNIVNEAENFFKHADKNPRGLLKFNPEQTEFLILDAVEMYMQLAAEAPEDMSIFRVWFFIKYPNIISDETQSKLKEQNLHYNIQHFRGMNKTEFYKIMKETLNMRI